MVEIWKIVVIPATGTFEPGLLPFGITTLKLPSPSTMKLPHLAGSAALILLPNEKSTSSIVFKLVFVETVLFPVMRLDWMITSRCMIMPCLSNRIPLLIWWAIQYDSSILERCGRWLLFPCVQFHAFIEPDDERIGITIHTLLEDNSNQFPLLKVCLISLCQGQLFLRLLKEVFCPGTIPKETTGIIDNGSYILSCVDQSQLLPHRRVD